MLSLKNFGNLLRLTLYKALISVERLCRAELCHAMQPCHAKPCHTSTCHATPCRAMYPLPEAVECTLHSHTAITLSHFLTGIVVSYAAEQLFREE